MHRNLLYIICTYLPFIHDIVFRFYLTNPVDEWTVKSGDLQPLMRVLDQPNL